MAENSISKLATVLHQTCERLQSAEHRPTLAASARALDTILTSKPDTSRTRRLHFGDSAISDLVFMNILLNDRLFPDLFSNPFD